MSQIAAQHGFNDDFLSLFRFVTATGGTACGQAMRTRRPVIVEDLLFDREFAPYRAIAIDAGFRAVQSTPLVSSSGAFVGVLSTHSPARHRPTDSEMQAIGAAAELAANAIIYQKALLRTAVSSAREDVQRQIAKTRAALQCSYELLQRTGRRTAHA